MWLNIDNKKDKNSKKEKVDDNKTSGGGDGNSKNSGNDTKKKGEHVDVHDEGNVIMFGEIPVEISPSPSGNTDRISSDIIFEEMKASAKKVKAKSIPSKATADAVSVTKHKEGIARTIQRNDSTVHPCRE